MNSINMIRIDGFHKECPTERIFEIIKIFNDNHNIKIDIPHTKDKLIKSQLDSVLQPTENVSAL